MPLLNGALSLHDPRCKGAHCERYGCVRDTERFCRTVLDTEIRRRHITRIEYDDALVHLIEEAWRLSVGFNVQLSDRRRISTYIRRYLPDRFTNWLHAQLGRTDHEPVLYLEDLSDRHAATTSSDDLPARVGSDLARLIRPRSSDTAEAIDRMGKATARRTRARPSTPPPANLEGIDAA